MGSYDLFAFRGEECALRVLNPLSDTRQAARVLRACEGGLRIRISECTYPGGTVQIGLRSAIVLGQVRDCCPAGVEFDIDVQIDEVFPLS